MKHKKTMSSTRKGKVIDKDSNKNELAEYERTSRSERGRGGSSHPPRATRVLILA